MINRIFKYKGFAIKVIAHEFFTQSASTKHDLDWHTAAVVITPGTESDYPLEDEHFYPDRVSVSPERAVEYGKCYAKRAIDEHIQFAILSKFLASRPI